MSGQTTTMLHVREMILRGELRPGERVREAELAAKLGISRMPIRQALPALALEGLLVRSGSKGFAVREFSDKECLEALHLRASLEGLAARALAQQGAPKKLIAQLRECLAEGDEIFKNRVISEGDETRYAEMNARFHTLILEGANMPLLMSLVSRCNVVPFTDPLSIVFSLEDQKHAFNLLFYAHRQHHGIVSAIEQGLTERAEFLFREHAFAQEQSQGLDTSSRQRHAAPALRQVNQG